LTGDLRSPFIFPFKPVPPVVYQRVVLDMAAACAEKVPAAAIPLHFLAFGDVEAGHIPGEERASIGFLKTRREDLDPVKAPRDLRVSIRNPVRFALRYAPRYGRGFTLPSNTP
jgi:hypothetical protein